MIDHPSCQGAPSAVAELLAAHLEPILVQVSRDPEAQCPGGDKPGLSALDCGRIYHHAVRELGLAPQEEG